MVKPLQIGSVKVGPGQPCFVIAEIGNNHNGSYEKAIELIELAIEAGANSVKFQMRHMDKVYRKQSLAKSGDDLGVEYTIDLLRRMELTHEEHKKIRQYCQEKNIFYFCTPWDEDSIDVLEELDVPVYKVASADFSNRPLLDRLVATGKPLILSTGMSSSQEIRTMVNYLNDKKVAFAILHCNSTYPAPFQNIQLNYLHELATIHPYVGYSGHERGIGVSIGAVALGAQVIERHFTLDRNMEGPDHAASLEFDDFRRMVEGIRQVEQALGARGDKSLSQGVMINRENLGKSLIAARPLPKGTVLTHSDIVVRSPGLGLVPSRLDELVGATLQRDMKEEEFFYASDLGSSAVQPRGYKFRRPWGVPVRYHDFKDFYGRIQPDLVEFHLSYSDLDRKPKEYFNEVYPDVDFVVHAPELFAGSHLMDLATADEGYRKNSIIETQRVIDATRELKKFFPKTKRPLIVANIGGFSMDRPIPESEKSALYQRFAESLKQLDLDGVELIPQTMAPFPWHFGGQRYQNLFVLPEETVEICRRLGLRICLDVSHSKLTATHFKLDFNHLLTILAPITAHLHLGDSKSVDGEGLQIGDGEIDFEVMARILDESAPRASFIPEIWQGHKNSGEGFWVALDRLEGVF